MWSEISDEDRAGKKEMTFFFRFGVKLVRFFTILWLLASVYDARALEEKQRLQNELKAREFKYLTRMM